MYSAYVTTIVGSLLSARGTKEDMEEVRIRLLHCGKLQKELITKNIAV